MKIRWVLWIAAILLFSALGLLFALPSLSSANWQRVLLGSLIQWWSWGLIAPLIPWIDMRLPFKENQLLKRVLAHIPVSVIVTIFYSCIVTSLGWLVGLINWSVIASKPFLGNLAPSLLWNWLVYWVIFGVLQTFSYYQRYLASELRAARMERSSSEARLNALRMQLDPHFLFNALNTISAQVERDPVRQPDPRRRPLDHPSQASNDGTKATPRWPSGGRAAARRGRGAGVFAGHRDR